MTNISNDPSRRAENDDNYGSQIEEAAEAWHREGLPTPEVVLIAGSGLSGDFGSALIEPRELSALLPFEAKGISGHSLRYDLLSTPRGQADGSTLYFRGRLHAYQGFSAAQVVFAIRFAAVLGVQVAIVTNAAGGLYPGVRAGDLSLLSDHINLTGLNPLRGSMPEPWGPQFPDMSHAYDPRLRALARRHAEALGIELGEAVYLGVLGPSYETPAEIRAFAGMGAGLVGMSTVLEVIAARQLGVRCLGLSLVTNPAAGFGEDVLEHGDVLEIGRRAADRVQRLIAAILGSEELVGD